MPNFRRTTALRSETDRDADHECLTMEEVGFGRGNARCRGWFIAASTQALAGAHGRPAIAMAHGFGCTRDGGLLPFAQAFARAGVDVLLFDYRGYGTSPGRPRQDVNHWTHRADYRAAVAFLRARPGVDADRIAVWGTSYSGGHVIAVAAGDPRIAAVISQGAAMDGVAALKQTRRADRETAAPERAAKRKAMARAIGADIVRAASRRAAVMIPVFGSPKDGALITVADGDAGFQAIIGETFRNEMAARGLLRIAFNRPVRVAHRVSCPVHLVLAQADEVAPCESVREVARRVRGPVDVLELPGGHFGIYVGETMQTSLATQLRFLAEVFEARRT